MDGGPGAWIRAARRERRWSQRELARYAGVSQTTLARIESGKHATSLRIFVDLIAAAGYGIAITDAKGRPLLVDAEHDRLRDAGRRRLPAHLPWEDAPDYMRTWYWWGWQRIAWPTYPVPDHIWFHRPRQPPAVSPRHSWTGRELGYVWDDAT